MAENYWYSSLTAQEIEDTLLGAVRSDVDQTLTTSEKARARANIGAGESNSTFKVLGYFDTYEDMIESLQLLPQPGDAYGIGTASPYDIYVYDGVHSTWVNNGPIAYSDALIDDEDVASNRAWSSSKISTELATKQAKINENGILKGNGSGGVSAAVAGTDYLTPATNYSPCKTISGSSYTIVASDICTTLCIDSSLVGKTITLPKETADAMPRGAEIAFLIGSFSDSAFVTLSLPRNYGLTPLVNRSFSTAKLNGAGALYAIKRVWGAGWVVTGPNVEVVS